jgi:hypothetical protein
VDSQESGYVARHDNLKETLMEATRSTLLALAAVATVASEVEAQRFTQVPPPPDQPAAEGFDPERALFFAQSNFDPLRDPDWSPLRDVRDAGDVADDQPVLVFEAGGETLVLVSSQMSYHHVAQGEMAGEPWMVTF